jgi:hypothetical protein
LHGEGLEPRQTYHVTPASPPHQCRVCCVMLPIFVTISASARNPHRTLRLAQGCVSQVWVVPELRDGRMFWTADSDAQLTKGLAALLVKGLSGSTPQEIVKVEADFIERLGLKQSLTPSRNNGFLNMFRLMQVRPMPMKDSASGKPYTVDICVGLQPWCSHSCHVDMASVFSLAMETGTLRPSFGTPMRNNSRVRDAGAGSECSPSTGQ